VADQAPHSGAAGGRGSEPRAPRHTILLVEDNADNRHIYAVYLAHLGFAVLTAEDAETGLALVAERHPDLVVMDVSLPGMDGHAATRALKADAATSHIPVVILTAHAQAADRDRALAAGGDVYLSKPLDPAALGRELRRILRGTELT
jgi:two-component system, cell cycle response regulator DivK